MTPEDLDKLDRERAKEAARLLRDITTSVGTDYWPAVARTAARLAREGWMPPDPLAVEIDAVIAEHESTTGLTVSINGRRLTRKAMERGVAIGKAQS